MNRVFKSIWNAVTQSWTAVSEAQQNRGKKSKNIVLAALICVGLFSPTANAWIENKGMENDLVIGDNTKAAHEDRLIFSEAGLDGLNYQFAWDDARGTLTTGTSLDISAGGEELFNHSDGLVQTLLTVDNLTWYPRAHTYDSTIQSSESSAIVQGIRQNNQDTGVGYYAIGTGAYQILMANQEQLDVTSGETVEGHLNVKLGDSWGDSANLEFSDTGIHHPEGGSYFSTIALLVGFEINSNQTLVLDVSDNRDWYTKIHGDETTSIRYTGDGESVINFIALNDGADFKLGNSDYEGATYFEGITANLYALDSLGQTSKLTATNVAINVKTSEAWSSVKGLSYNNVDTVFEAQNTFTVSNANGEAATYVGENTIKTGSDSFTYTVEGSAEIGSLTQTGSLIFEQASGGPLNLNIGDDLTIYAGSSLTGATNVVVEDELNLYSASGISESTALKVGTALNFIDINGGIYGVNTQQTSENGAFAVNVENSTLEYKDGITMTVSETTVKGNSNLTVHGTDLLGNKVIFEKTADEGSGAYSMVTINKTNDSGSWNLDELTLTNSREDDRAVVFVKGDGFSLDQSLGDYDGWLRLGDMKFELTSGIASYLNSDSSSNKPSVGLSIGQGATLVVNKHLNLDKFGWGGNDGVLDLTQHIHDDADGDSPILEVGTLVLNGTGTIKLDPSDYVQAQTPLTGGSVLDYDNGDKDNRYFIVTADEVQGSSAIHLDVVGGIENSTVTELKHGGDDGTEVAANAYWDYIAATTSGEAVDGERGVYISYGLERLELVGQDDAHRSLVIALDSSNDKDLQAQVTGNGIIDIVSRDSSSKSVQFSNTKNTFEGTVNVRDGVTLSALAGSLSSNAANKGTVNVNLIDGAGLHIVAQGGAQQYLNSIFADDDSTVEIDSSTGLVITGNSFHSVIDGTLSGQGALSVMGGQLLSNAETLNGFGGTVSVSDDGSLALDVDAEKDQTLTKTVSTDDDSWLVKLGDGTLSFDFADTTRNSSALNVWVYNGTVILDENTSFGNIHVGSSSEGITVNGLTEMENLTGGGQIFMDFDFGSDHNNGALGDAGDGLKVSGSASGDYVLVASSNDLNKGAVETLRVMEVDGDATNFELALQNGYIVSGAFDYRLVRTDEGNGAVFDLTSVDGVSDKRNTTVTAGSYIGIAYAAQMFDLSLHDRVGNRDWINPVTGEKQTTSLWMHHTMSHERFRDSTEQLRMRTTSNTTMLGGDLIQWTPSGSGLAYVGVMGGYGTMDTKSHSKQTDRNSSAETDTWGVGVYGGWKADAEGQLGPYVDGWIMFTHASSDVTGSYDDAENVNGQGLSAQLETGWGFKLGSVATDNGKLATFTFEPHASVTWFGMEYDEIHNDAQDVQFEGTNNIRTRLGARVILTEEGNNNFNAFIETNWVHNSKEYGATISGITINQTGSQNQGEARIGVDWRLTQDVLVWGRVGAAFGSDGYSEREGSVGIRYQF